MVVAESCLLSYTEGDSESSGCESPGKAPDWTVTSCHMRDPSGSIGPLKQGDNLITQFLGGGFISAAHGDGSPVDSIGDADLVERNGGPIALDDRSDLGHD